MRGVAVDAAMNDGATPLYVTARKGHAAVVRILIDAGADRAKQTLIGTASEAAGRNGQGVVAALLE
jgi:ankyrin repeat protein